MYLIINGKRVKKKKTMSAKGSDPKSPIWNEAFTFNLPSTSFPSSGLEVKHIKISFHSFYIQI